MSFELLRASVIAAFIEGYKTPEAAPFSPAHYPNQSFTEPSGERWIRVTIQPGETIPASIGATLTRTLGFLFIQVFIPVGQGSQPANEIADKISAFLNLTQLTPALGQDITFNTVSLEHVRDTAQWSEWLASCKFRHDTIASPQQNIVLFQEPPYSPGVTRLIGGTATDLDGIDVSGWKINSFVLTYANDNSIAATGTRYRVYYLRSMVGVEPENAPSLIISDDEPTKVFELLA